METNVGINVMLQLLGGTGNPTPYSSNYARIGVGDGGGSVPTPAATDTALKGTTNTVFVGMNGGYPQIGPSPYTSLIFQATFAAGVGSFAWREWGIDNGAGGGPATLFNHKGVSLGTKPPSATWTFQVSVIQT